MSGHEDTCACTRCAGFTAGNTLSVRHGAYSVVELRGRAGTVAEGICSAMVGEQLWREAFRPTVEACAVVLVRLERANAALAEVDERMEVDGGGPLASYLSSGDDDPLAKLRRDATTAPTHASPQAAWPMARS